MTEWKDVGNSPSGISARQQMVQAASHQQPRFPTRKCRAHKAAKLQAPGNRWHNASQPAGQQASRQTGRATARHLEAVPLLMPASSTHSRALPSLGRGLNPLSMEEVLQGIAVSTLDRRQHPKHGTLRYQAQYTHCCTLWSQLDMLSPPPVNPNCHTQHNG